MCARVHFHCPAPGTPKVPRLSPTLGAGAPASPLCLPGHTYSQAGRRCPLASAALFLLTRVSATRRPEQSGVCHQATRTVGCLPPGDQNSTDSGVCHQATSTALPRVSVCHQATRTAQQLVLSRCLRVAAAGQSGQVVPRGPCGQRAAEEKQERGPARHRGALHQPVTHDAGVCMPVHAMMGAGAAAGSWLCEACD